MTCVLIYLTIKTWMLGIRDFRDATSHAIVIHIACQQLHPYFNKEINTYFLLTNPVSHGN